MLTIAGLTFREVLSKKIFYIVLVLTVIFLAVFAIALHFTVADMNKWAAHNSYSVIRKAVIFPQLLSLGLYFSTFIVAFMAIFATVNSVSGEIETGTIQAVIAKPLNRTEFILGKFLGYALMMTVYASVLYLAVIAIMKIITGYNPGGVLTGLALFILIPFLLMGLSLAGSCFLSTMANGVSVIMLYIIGTIGGMVEQIGSMLQNTTLINLGVLSSLVIPTDALYRKMIFGLLTGPENPINTFSVNPFATSSPPSSVMIIYSLIYFLFTVVAAIKIFNKRDI